MGQKLTKYRIVPNHFWENSQKKQFSTSERQYPFVMRQPYPKTGEEHLPEVWLNIWRKKDGKMKRMAVGGIAARSQNIANKILV
jgi:hypothetical protein